MWNFLTNANVKQHWAWLVFEWVPFANTLFDIIPLPGLYHSAFGRKQSYTVPQRHSHWQRMLRPLKYQLTQTLHMFLRAIHSLTPSVTRGGGSGLSVSGQNHLTFLNVCQLICGCPLSWYFINQFPLTLPQYIDTFPPCVSAELINLLLSKLCMCFIAPTPSCHPSNL